MRIVMLRWLVATSMLGGCASIKPYEKEYLLNPLMEDKAVAELQPTLMPAASANFEKLAVGANSATGTACPTCGG
jgi:hypothetical protein